MQRVGLVAALLQVGGHLVHTAFGGTENKRFAKALRIQNAAQRVYFLVRAHFIVDLRNGGDGQHLVCDGQHLRVAQKPFAQLAYGRRHGGGKQHALAVGRGLLKDGFNIFAKAHVQHFIGFIQYDQGCRVQLQRTALQVVDEPAGGAHNHLHAFFQRTELSFNGLAAINGQNGNATFFCGQTAELCGYLNGQLAGGAEHQGLHLFPRDKSFQKRQTESGGLSGAGLGLTHGIAAGKQDRDSQELYGRGLFKAQIFHGVEQVLGQAQIFK